MSKPWYLYILSCADGTLYTGITTDVPARLNAHNTGKGAKYTKGRSPCTLLKTYTFDNKSQASKEEYRIKQLTKTEKLTLIKC